MENFTSQGKLRDRCRLSHNYHLMFRPGLGPSSVVDQKVHGMVTYIHKRGGGGLQERGVGWKIGGGGNTGGCVGGCLHTNAAFDVKHLEWV